MIFNFKESFHLSVLEWFSVLWNGLKLDISAAAYLMITPVIILSIFSLFNITSEKRLINIYTYIFLLIVLFLGVVDMELYSYWGFKLDLTPLIYLKTPKEAVASVHLIEIVFLTLIFTVLFLFWRFIYRRFIALKSDGDFHRKRLFSVAGIFLLGLLIIPVRGGFGIAPVNISSVYFHNNHFANHSAINVLWNSIYSISERKKLQTSYKFMGDDKAEMYFDNLHKNSSNPEKIINNNCNVIIIILESFSNQVIGFLNGHKDITPQLNEICRNSVVFTNFYATGDRSDKGIVGILSGFPAQPTISIINYPSKAQKLPFLPQTFHDHGYFTSFYYGGDINFANLKSYLTNQAMDRIITIKDFPKKLKTQKWGVPDEYLFHKILNDTDTLQNPFFLVAFTLSSHEPYDIPMEPFFGNSTIDDKSKSAFYYTDKYLGEFVNNAKSRLWWDNTLIIIMSDHGARYPGYIKNHVREKFQIPMIWTGGAVLKSDTVISKYCSQTDFPLTLLNQFGFKHQDYDYSKDMLDKSSPSYCMYFFNNGFGFLSDSISLIYDNNINQYFVKEGRKTALYEETGKAYLQRLSIDFHSR